MILRTMDDKASHFVMQLAASIRQLKLKFNARDCGYMCFEFDSLRATQGRTLGPQLGQLVMFDGLDELGINSLKNDYGQSSKLREAVLGQAAFDFHIKRLKTPLPAVPSTLTGVLRVLNGFHHAGGASLCGVHRPRPRGCTLPLSFTALNVFESHGRKAHELIVGMVVNTDRSVLFLNTLNGRIEQRFPHSESVLHQWDDVCQFVLESLAQSVNSKP